MRGGSGVRWQPALSGVGRICNESPVFDEDGQLKHIPGMIKPGLGFRGVRAETTQLDY